MKAREFGNRLARGGAIIAVTMLAGLGVSGVAADENTGPSVYDETAYTEYVENMMDKLDQLYIDFSKAHGVDSEAATIAQRDFLKSMHELMHYMNAKFDSMDPKKGAALSPTETLVTVHAHTMLIDILAANQIDELKKHPYIE